jgi:hypothetical protein
MTSFGHTARSAVYYKAGSPLILGDIFNNIMLDEFPHGTKVGPDNSQLLLKKSDFSTCGFAPPHRIL